MCVRQKSRESDVLRFTWNCIASANLDCKITWNGNRKSPLWRQSHFTGSWRLNQISTFVFSETATSDFLIFRGDFGEGSSPPFLTSKKQLFFDLVTWTARRRYFTHSSRYLPRPLDYIRRVPPLECRPKNLRWMGTNQLSTRKMTKNLSNLTRN